MEYLAYIYSVLIVLVVADVLGLFVFRRQRGKWLIPSLLIIAAIGFICLIEVAFIGVRDVVGVAMLLIPIFAGVAISWLSQKMKLGA